MEKDSVGFVETKFFTFAEPPDEMELESGERLGPITIAYETYGELSDKADNAILITHALSGDAHVAGYHSAEDKKPGWWDYMVGPGRTFDTDRYFVICSNVIGGCIRPRLSSLVGDFVASPLAGCPAFRRWQTPHFVSSIQSLWQLRH